MTVKVADPKRATARSRAPAKTAALAAAAGSATLEEAGVGKLSQKLDAFILRSGLAPSEVSGNGRQAALALIAEIDRLEAELKKAKAKAAQLERLAHEDAFMPVGNRRAFVRELSRLIALAKRYGITSSMVYIDLNGMKQINDRHGHNAGDAALIQVARILTDNVRHADVVARLGGDEFGVLLVKTGPVECAIKARALVQAVESVPFVWNGQTIPLTAACGTYSVTGDETVAAALDYADQAMYRDKQAAKASGAARGAPASDARAP